jgi:multidrug efflux pump subunit AcrB
MGVLIFGFTLNQLTLFGLVLATGLVVDDAITIIENTSTKRPPAWAPWRRPSRRWMASSGR